jgi:hypothetical protein
LPPATSAALVGERDDCDVLPYQAGADPHIDNPLDCWLTTEQLARRDRIVFPKRGAPVAARGIGSDGPQYRQAVDGNTEPILLIHRNTMRAEVAVYA